MEHILKEVLHRLVIGILQKIPVEFSRFGPFLILREVLTHEEQLLTRVSHHESISCNQVLELIHAYTRHLIDHGTLQMNHFVMREYQNILLILIVGHCEGHLIMVVLAEIRI